MRYGGREQPSPRLRWPRKPDTTADKARRDHDIWSVSRAGSNRSAPASETADDTPPSPVREAENGRINVRHARCTMGDGYERASPFESSAAAHAAEIAT